MIAPPSAPPLRKGRLGGVVEIALGGLAEQELAQSEGFVKGQKEQKGTLRTLMSLRALRALRPLKKTLDAKKRKVRCKCKGVRMTLSLFGCGAIGRLKAVKNAKCGANARRTRKRARSLLAQMRSSHRLFCVFWSWH